MEILGGFLCLAIAAGGMVFARQIWQFIQAASLAFAPAFRAIATGMVSLNKPLDWHKPDELADHAGHELVDCQSSVMSPNELVATLCVTCDEQLGPEVWSAKMTKELAALESAAEVATNVAVTEKVVQVLHHEIETLRKRNDEIEAQLGANQVKLARLRREKPEQYSMRGWKIESENEPMKGGLCEVRLRKGDLYARVPMSDVVYYDPIQKAMALSRFVECADHDLAKRGHLRHVDDGNDWERTENMRNTAALMDLQKAGILSVSQAKDMAWERLTMEQAAKADPVRFSRMIQKHWES